jgi:hypothetical protein
MDSKDTAINANPITVDGLTLDQWIEKETAPETPSLWGKVYPEYSPYLCETKLGDGLQLIYFGTIDQRPYYWLVLIDSKTDLNASDFDIEQIVDLVEEECGRNSQDDYATEEEYMAENFHYPMVDWEGGHVGTIVNFGNGKVG